MSTFPMQLSPTSLGVQQHLSIFLREARLEFVRAFRNRGFSLSVIGFPLMFYVLFGIMNRSDVTHGQLVAKHMLATYAVFGMVGAALFGIGVGLALERSSGWLELKRASPMPPLAYLLAKCCMAMAFGVVIVSLLCILGTSFAGVQLSLREYLGMLGVTVLGSVPFASMGLLLAMLMPANAAPGIANMIYLPMSYCSGLWMPAYLLPKWMQHFAPALPTYHLAQIMLGRFGYAQPGSMATHWISLLGFTCLFLGIGWLAFQRAEESM